MNNNVTCEHCRWWVPVGESQQPDGAKIVVGECRRFAPRPNFAMTQAQPGQIGKLGMPQPIPLGTFFPLTAAPMFCGDAELAPAGGQARLKIL